MKHLTKRIVSMVLCVMMALSMVTAIVLPAAAVDTETTPVNNYAKVTLKEGTNEPTDNVFFFKSDRSHVVLWAKGLS